MYHFLLAAAKFNFYFRLGAGSRTEFHLLPVESENIAEVMSRVDVSGHTEAQHDGVLAVDHQCPVDDVDE